MRRPTGAPGSVKNPPDALSTRLDLSVVIPVYNEQDILSQTVAAVVGAFRDSDVVTSFEVVVCENGSSDGTRELGRELAVRYEEVVLLESDLADYGAAMRDGFRASRGDVIVNFDADYYDVDFVRRALDVDADIVVAAKGIAGSNDTRTLLRRLVSRVFSLFVRRLLRLRTTETHGMKLFRRGAIEPLLSRVEATKDLFDTELLARAERSGLTIAELPITTQEMRHSRSGILRRIPRTMWGLVMMRRRLRRDERLLRNRVAEADRTASRVLRSLLEDDPEAFGERLLVVGDTAGAIHGAEEAVLTLDESGAAVLVVVVPAATTGTGADIADELDRIAVDGLAGMAELQSPAEPTPLAGAHAAFFGDAADTSREINHDQKAVVVVRERPDTPAWEELVVELGPRLLGVHQVADGDDVVPLAVPDDLLRRRERLSPRAGRATLLGIGLLAVGVATVLVTRTLDAPPQAPAATPAAVRHVAAPAPAAATHNWWVGQDHLVRTSQGTLLAVHGSDQGLHIVADDANQGRSWQAPAVLPEIGAGPSSVVIDDRDRLHVAFSDGSRVAYALAEQRGGRWTVVSTVDIDASTTTPYLDVAYDEAAGVSHVVWVEDAGDGQAPRWAAVAADADAVRVVATERLAPPGGDIPVLVNVAAGPQSAVVATYRRGDSPLGWFARALGSTAGDQLSWGAEERLPTEEGIGASDIVVDRSGVAHLVLRDSTTFALTYFTRRPGGGWSQGETAVDAERTEEIDFPSLAVDRASRLVYLFFQSDRAQPTTGIQIAVRDPARGWLPPFPAAPPQAIPAGATLPTALSETDGAPIVMWTTGGPTPIIQAAVVAP